MTSRLCTVCQDLSNTQCSICRKIFCTFCFNQLHVYDCKDKEYTFVCKYNTMAEYNGYDMLILYLSKYNNSKFVRCIILDESLEYSLFEENTSITIAIKKNWDIFDIVNAFLHEQMHCFSHSVKYKRIKKLGFEIKLIWDYRGYEFDKIETTDDGVLDNFTDHLIVMFNVIQLMHKQLNVDYKYFLSKQETYPLFNAFIISHLKQVEELLTGHNFVFS